MTTSEKKWLPQEVSLAAIALATSELEGVLQRSPAVDPIG